MGVDPRLGLAMGEHMNAVSVVYERHNGVLRTLAQRHLDRVTSALLAGNADAGLDSPAPAARADGPEPAPVQPVAAERVIAGARSGGDDGDPVEAERIRQSRLARWQRQDPRR